MMLSVLLEEEDLKDGSLHEVTALALSTTVLNSIKKRNELDGHSIEDVIWGNVTQIENKELVSQERQFWLLN